MRKAYWIDLSIDPASLPFVFDGERALIVHGDGYVEVEGLLDGWVEVALRDAIAAPETPEQIKKRLIDAIQQTLDNGARQRGYDGILSACSYVGDPDPVFGAEGVAFMAWRSAVWRYGYGVLTDVEAALRPIPTEAELLSELPILQL